MAVHDAGLAKQGRTHGHIHTYPTRLAVHIQTLCTMHLIKEGAMPDYAFATRSSSSTTDSYLQAFPIDVSPTHNLQAVSADVSHLQDHTVDTPLHSPAAPLVENFKPLGPICLPPVVPSLRQRPAQPQTWHGAQSSLPAAWPRLPSAAGLAPVPAAQTSNAE